MHYPIDQALWNGKNDGAGDLSAFFMSGYDVKENALYLAVVAEDDELVLGTKDDDIDYLDAYILYLNEQNKKSGSGIARYIIAEHQSSKLDPEISWDPKLHDLASWDNVTYKTMSKGTKRIYEFKIILEAPIYEGRVIGVGHLVDDKDQDKQTSYGWVGQSSKYSSSRPGNIGMLVFKKDNDDLGLLSGTVAWKDSAIKNQSPEGVFVHSASNPRIWYFLPTNRNTGGFKGMLPSGKYVLKPGKVAFFNGRAFVKADTSKTMPITIKANKKTSNVKFELSAITRPDVELQTNILHNLGDQATQRDLDEVIKRHMEYYQIEGVSFAAFKDGRITYKKAYGVKNNYTKDAVDENTLFEVASITKTVFAYTVLRLHEKGIIDIDELLYKHLPFERSSNSAYNELLTARIVLSHKSGLPNWGYSSNIEYKFKPGTDYGYSGEAFEYLKRVIEKITDKSIDDVLNAEVVIPLGLENMYFNKQETAMQLKAHGHSNTFATVKRMPSTTGVAYSLTTNPKSLAKFIIAIQERKGLKPETFDLMFSKQTSLPEDVRSNIWNYNEYMGLGFFIEEAPYGKVIRHSGSNGNYRAIFRIYDDLDMGYIITTNGNSGGFILDNIERNLIDPDKLPKQE
jgi:CubicO group peptidase (beta-lactamase class C family)